MKFVRLLSCLCAVFLLVSCSDDETKSNDSGQKQTEPCQGCTGTCTNGVCIPNQPVDPCLGCTGTCTGGVCIPNQPVDPCEGCTGTCTNGVCIPNQPVDPCEGCTGTCTNGVCVPKTIPDTSDDDPCKGVSCTSGTCLEGVCVTPEMKNIKEDAICDPETFVEFCDGNRVVYCDQGAVVIGQCDERCVVYEETYFGIVRQQAGCVDGGECTELNAVTRTCSVVQGNGQVLVTACQKTTRNKLQWVSVDGYYCRGLCDGNSEKCALLDGECDPLDRSNYSCDRKSLTKCQLDSNLMGMIRNEYCDDKCIQVNGISMCGYACDTEGAQQTKCVNADSEDIRDSGKYVCVKADNNALYSVWNGDYSICFSSCNEATGSCNE